MARPSFTLGIEEEFQVVDPATFGLRSQSEAIFLDWQQRFKGDEIKRELHAPVVEIATPICADIREARDELTRLRGDVIRIARANGLRIAAAGTHPFTHWSEVAITPGAHYGRLIEDLQMIARANLIFGLHVHVAVEDDEARIAIMNGVRYFLPHIFSLSVNSPFWTGRDTGWKSFRAKIFERFPRTGIPDYFGSFGAYREFLETLIETGCITDGKKIWWDVRPHPFFPTLEYRICDVQLRIEDTLCLAALFQAVTYKLWQLYDRNQGWRLYRRSLINENKWRAARFGLGGKLIDLGKRTEVPTAELLVELLEFIDDVVDDLNVRAEVAYVYEIIERKTGADRQLDVFARTGSLEAVVDYVIEETEAGIPVA